MNWYNKRMCDTGKIIMSNINFLKPNRENLKFIFNFWFIILCTRVN